MRTARDLSVRRGATCIPYDGRSFVSTCDALVVPSTTRRTVPLAIVPCERCRGFVVAPEPAAEWRPLLRGARWNTRQARRASQVERRIRRCAPGGLPGIARKIPRSERRRGRGGAFRAVPTPRRRPAIPARALLRGDESVVALAERGRRTLRCTHASRVRTVRLTTPALPAGLPRCRPGPGGSAVTPVTGRRSGRGTHRRRRRARRPRRCRSRDRRP